MVSLEAAIRSQNSWPSPIAPWLENIIAKKVSNIALDCFEFIVHWFLTTFSCFYPAYQTFYDHILGRVSQETNTLFLNCHESNVREAASLHLIPDVANLVADYVVQGESFGSKDWEEVFRVQTEQVTLSSEFYSWWFSPDEEDVKEAIRNPEPPIRLNCHSHFLPILVPKTVIPLDVPDAQNVAYNLEILDRLVQNPQEGGHPSRFNSQYGAFEAIKKLGAEEPRWVVARKELVDRGRWAYSSKSLPSALAVATIAQVLRVKNPEQLYLGDHTGLEGRTTYTCVRERARITKFESLPIHIGNSSPLQEGPLGGLTVKVGSNNDSLFLFPRPRELDDIGISLIREFPAIKQ